MEPKAPERRNLRSSWVSIKFFQSSLRKLSQKESEIENASNNFISESMIWFYDIHSIRVSEVIYME